MSITDPMVKAIGILLSIAERFDLRMESALGAMRDAHDFLKRLREHETVTSDQIKAVLLELESAIEFAETLDAGGPSPPTSLQPSEGSPVSSGAGHTSGPDTSTDKGGC